MTDCVLEIYHLFPLFLILLLLGACVPTKKKVCLSGAPFGSLMSSILGVKFMYDCVMGLRKHEGQGCILADEMSVILKALHFSPN